jgi:tetratricopeptide (TPR) repeat protein
VLWLYASNEARFEQSVRSVLDQLRVRGRKDPKANVFQLLRNRLCDANKGPWLVILDNADDARVLLGSPSVNDQVDKSAEGALPTEARLDYIPRCGHGKVLVTSRSKEVAKELVYSKDVVAVEPMEEEQALELLRKKLDTWYTKQHVLRLARELDYMPLALAQAAAYICQRDGRCSIEQYLDKIGEYDISGTSILDVEERDLRRDRGASNSIMLTWQISFNHIREVRRSAADLLSLMSFFDRQAIPEALLHERGSGRLEDDVNRDGKPHAISNTSADEHDDQRNDKHQNNAEARESSNRGAKAPSDAAGELDKDVIVLRNYHFITLTTEATVFEMHKLVQLATKKWLKAKCQLERWGSQFINNLDDAFPAGNFENWEACHSLFPHATAALHTEVTGREAALRKASLLHHSAEYALSTGAYVDAEKMEERSLQARRDVLGEGHPDTLRSIGNLAVTYSDQGRWEEAEKVQVEVMEKRKEALGEGRPSTLTSMNNLAATYSKQGRWEEAEKLQVEVTEKSKEALGEGHPSTLTSMNNLAVTYSDQGRWDEAEKLQVEVVEKMKELFEEGHPDTLTSMANLAFTIRALGRRKSALVLMNTCVDNSPDALGVDHPDTRAFWRVKTQWEEEDVLLAGEEAVGTVPSKPTRIHILK